MNYPEVGMETPSKKNPKFKVYIVKLKTATKAQ